MQKQKTQTPANQGFGEAFEEMQAMNNAGQANPSQGSGANPSPQQLQQMAQQMGGESSSNDKARDVGTLKQELVTRPIEDVTKQVKSLFDINSMLGINEAKDTPEEQMKKKQLHQRFQNLTAEQKQVADQILQMEMEKKKHQEQEEQIKKQQQAQKDAQAIAAPSSPQKGPKGPGGSGKKRAVAQLEQDRKTLNGPMKVD